MLEMVRRAPVTITYEGSKTVLQPTGDVKAWDTYFSPDDDIHAVLISALREAHDETVVFSSQYGFTDLEVANEFARLGKNIASRFLFDQTQAAGDAEAPVLQGLVARLERAQWAIGTSKKAHQLLHSKAVVLLYPDGQGWTLTGSFNLSASARDQFNIVDVVTSRSRADLFARQISAMFDWVKQNEGGNQI